MRTLSLSGWTAARRQAARAVSISGAVTSAWVSIRTRPATTVTRSPAAASRRIHSSAGAAVLATSTNTMLVWTLAGSTPPGTISATPSASRRAFGVILGQPGWAVPQRDLAGGGHDPGLPPGPAEQDFHRACFPDELNAFPAGNDPIGAPSPLDRQNISASTCRVYSATVVPATTAALKIRAPSR